MEALHVSSSYPLGVNSNYNRCHLAFFSHLTHLTCGVGSLVTTFFLSRKLRQGMVTSGGLSPELLVSLAWLFLLLRWLAGHKPCPAPLYRLVLQASLILQCSR